MLSSIALRNGAFRAVLKSHCSKRAAVLLQSRAKSETTAQIEQWDKANQMFYGPERDTKTFPHPVQPEYGGKVRMGFIPEEWFAFFYPKTGVTGPYLFGAGLVSFLLSAEIWVVDHGFSEVIGYWGAIIILTKKLGPSFTKYIDDLRERYLEETVRQPIVNAKAGYHEEVDDCEKAIWREEGQKYLFDAKKENLGLQLEAVYRQRLQTAHDEVKKRLDYHLEIQNVQRHFEQQHMVNWIVQSVVKSITPQQEKESIAKCIQNLRNLSTAQAAAT